MKPRLVHNRPDKGQPMVPLLLLVAGLGFGGVTFALAPSETLAAMHKTVMQVFSDGYLTAGDCVIKGNVSHYGGQRIYHVPGQEYYSATKISKGSGERWFCSEADARAAGWRKAKV